MFLRFLEDYKPVGRGIASFRGRPSVELAEPKSAPHGESSAPGGVLLGVVLSLGLWLILALLIWA